MICYEFLMKLLKANRGAWSWQARDFTSTCVRRSYGKLVNWAAADYEGLTATYGLRSGRTAAELVWKDWACDKDVCSVILCA